MTQPTPAPETITATVRALDARIISTLATGAVPNAPYGRLILTIHAAALTALHLAAQHPREWEALATADPITFRITRADALVLDVTFGVIPDHWRDSAGTSGALMRTIATLHDALADNLRAARAARADRRSTRIIKPLDPASRTDLDDAVTFPAAVVRDGRKAKRDAATNTQEPHA